MAELATGIVIQAIGTEIAIRTLIRPSAMRTDMEIGVIRIGKEIVIATDCPTVHCPIQESMTIV